MFPHTAHVESMAKVSAGYNESVMAFCEDRPPVSRNDVGSVFRRENAARLGAIGLGYPSPVPDSNGRKNRHADPIPVRFACVPSYFATAIGLLALFLTVYVFITPLPRNCPDPRG